jgi:GntR family transcriptional regulator, transcriptional repressor for pyruvate dehydrogenase complex
MDQGDPLEDLPAVDRAAPVFVQVASHLIQAIEDGRFPVGSRLPTEQQLAEQFGVSRPSVREALSCLQFEGYVTPRQGSRTVITSAVPRSALQHQALQRRRDGTGQSRFSVADLLEARLTLEPQVLALAAADPDPQALPAVRQIVTGMKLALSQPGLHPSTDFEVHGALIRVCRNNLLVEAAERLLALGDNDVSRTARDGIWQERSLPWEWLDHHEAMARAVMDQEPELAAAACKQHLLSVLSGLAASPRTKPRERDRLSALVERAEQTPPGAAPAKSRTPEAKPADARPPQTRRETDAG